MKRLSALFILLFGAGTIRYLLSDERTIFGALVLGLGWMLIWMRET